MFKWVENLCYEFMGKLLENEYYYCVVYFYNKSYISVKYLFIDVHFASTCLSTHLYLLFA